MPEQVRLHKQVAIARSGVQFYTKAEVRSMLSSTGATIPKEFENLKLFGVYRSAPLLAAKKDLFAAQPFINTHKGFVNPENYSKWAQGWVGDSIAVEMNEGKTEAIIKGDLRILGQEAMDAYEDGTREVSPHYFGTYDWEPGEAPDGLKYHVVARDITLVNHLALVPRGRGGPDASIQDSAPGPLTAIWTWIKKKLSPGTADELSFRQELDQIAKARSGLTADQIEDRVGVLYKCLGKMPMNEDLDLLYRYLGDIKLLADNRSDEEATEYVNIVADLYEKLEERSLAEIMAGQEKEVKEGQEDAMTEEEEKAKKAEEAKAKETKDAEGKEMDAFMTKVKDHVAGGGKVSDFEVKGKKSSDEESEEEEKAKKAKEAKDAESEAEAKKKKEEEEEGAKDHALLGVYDGFPYNMGLETSTRIPHSEAAKNLVGALGFFGTKEKK